MGGGKPIVVGEFASLSWNPESASSSKMQDAESVDATANPLKVKVVKDRAIVADFRPAPGTNLLKNGDFAVMAGWEFSANTVGTAKGTVSYAAGQADIQITAAGTKDWHLQLQQGSGKPRMEDRVPARRVRRTHGPGSPRTRNRTFRLARGCGRRIGLSRPPISLPGWKRVMAPNPRFNGKKVAFSWHNGQP